MYAFLILSPHAPSNFSQVILLEAPAQKKAREDCEAMGGIWAGMAPTIKNKQVYSDFIHAQTKVRGS